MKNKKTLLGIGVAVIGSIISISTSLALYVNAPNDTVINIGTRTSSDVDMSITNAKFSASEKLQPGDSDDLTFNVGGSIPNGSFYTQNVYVANLTVTITASEAFVDYFSTNDTKLTISGYEASTYWTGQSTITFTKGEGNTLVASKTLPFTLDTTTHEASVTFTMPSDQENFLSIAESSYSASISITDDANYEHAYVKGTFNNWEVNDSWRMVPNIKANEFEWMHTLSSTHSIPSGAEFKAFKNDNVWSDGDNYKVNGTALTSGSLYWTGASDQGITYSAV